MGIGYTMLVSEAHSGLIILEFTAPATTSVFPIGEPCTTPAPLGDITSATDLAGVVFDAAERDNSAWPDTEGHIETSNRANLDFNDLAQITTGPEDDGIFRWIEIKSLDGEYCGLFNDLDVGVAFLVPMGIGYTMLVSEAHSGLIILEFTGPTTTARLPLGEPCVSADG